MAIGGRMIIGIWDSLLLERMAELKDLMLLVANGLDERGNTDLGAQLASASDMLQTWIDGIESEEK